MTVSMGWHARTTIDVTGVLLPPAAAAVIERASRLTRTEVVRLDLAERRRAASLPTAWDLLRDRLRDPAVLPLRFAARNAAWAAVTESLRRLELTPTPDDGYWRVVTRPGSGASRAARYAACALVAPQRLDEEVAELLLEPWTSVIRPRP